MNDPQRLAYVVPSLKRGGPSKQLTMIIKKSCLYFEVEIFALNTEPSAISVRNDFENLGVKITYLEGSFLSQRQKLKKILGQGEHSILHSQGLLPDVLLATLSLKVPWIVSMRNYAFEDYSLKFGRLSGWLLAKIHISAFKKPHALVACSNYIQQRYKQYGLSSTVIRNGVVLPKTYKQSKFTTKSEIPNILVVGSLIARKNNMPILRAHALVNKNRPCKLIFLGDGPERKELERIAQFNVEFKGQVEDVSSYYQKASLVISNSLSEGMPNAILEAIAHNLKCLLSDIEPHKELAMEFPELIEVINSDGLSEGLADQMSAHFNNSTPKINFEKKKIISEEFMVKKYLDKYWELINHAVK